MRTHAPRPDTPGAARGLRRPTRGGFTLVELLVVIGIIALLISILMPALTKARKAANAAVCLSNLRQLGQAWTIYLDESKGELPVYWWANHPAQVTSQTDKDEFAWTQGNVFALLAGLKTNSNFLVCPEAKQPIESAFNKGFGTVNAAWSGEWQGSTGTPISTFKGATTKFENDTNTPKPGGYRIGSYAAMRWMYIPTKKINGIYYPNPNGAVWGTHITQVKQSTEVPIFFDSVWPDQDYVSQGTVTNGQVTTMPPPPSDVEGSEAEQGIGDHTYRVIIARHGYGINVCFADGHADWVNLRDLTTLHWRPDWVPYTWSTLPKQ